MNSFVNNLVLDVVYWHGARGCRTRKGTVYLLLPLYVHDHAMHDYLIPEILRIPLDKRVFDCMSQTSHLESILGRFMRQPQSEAVWLANKNFKDLYVFIYNSRL